MRNDDHGHCKEGFQACREARRQGCHQEGAGEDRFEEEISSRIFRSAKWPGSVPAILFLGRRRVKPSVHNFLERGAGGFANVSLASGERIFLSLAANGLRLHRLIWNGRLPWGKLLAASGDDLRRMVRTLGREMDSLPELPKEAALQAFTVAATQAISDPSIYSRQPLDAEGFPATSLALLTRVALAELDAASLLRRLRRAAVTP